MAKVIWQTVTLLSGTVVCRWNRVHVFYRMGVPRRQPHSRSGL